MNVEQLWCYETKCGDHSSPMTESDLVALITKGELGRMVRVAPAGTARWIELEDSPFRESLAGENSGDETGKDSASPRPGRLRSVGRALPALTQRVFSSNLQGLKITESERHHLSEFEDLQGDPTMGGFLVWRRTILMTGTFLIILSSILGLPHSMRMIADPDVHAFVHFTNAAGLILPVGTAILMTMSFFSWKNYQRSRMFGRFALIPAFLLPFAMGLIPGRWFVQAHYQVESLGWAGYAGLYYAIGLIPLVISIFPAFLRSSIIMKSIIPESSLSGWIALIIAPFSALFFLIALILAIQIGNTPAVIMFAALTTAPLLLLAKVTRLIRPSSLRQASELLESMKLRVLSCYAIAIAGAAWLLANHPNADAASVLHFICKLGGSILIFKIIISDYFLGLIRFSLQSGESPNDGPLADSLRERMDHAGVLFEGPRAD
jgi:hypothetical protein